MSESVSLEGLLQEIASERGVDFRAYKRSTLERRFRRRMFDVKAGNYGQYSEYLRAHPKEINELLNTVLINVTEFFRDPQAWEVLRRDVLPMLLENKQPGDAVRCWSAGCASGEEPYSIAILLAEHFGPRLPEFDVKIYGTDIDEDALSVARRAEYPPDRLRRVRPDWRKKYFQGDKALRVQRDLRRLCIFGRSNVISDAPISHVDLLACRNLLIYFDSRAQSQILTRLHYALEPHGVLFIGKASSLVGAGQLYRPINSKYRIFERADSPVERRDGGAAVSGEGPRETIDDFLGLQHSALLDTLEPGVLILDAKDMVLTENASIARLWGIKNQLVNKPLSDTELGSLCPDLFFHLEQTREENKPVNFQCPAGSADKAHTLSVTLKPILSPGGGRVGTLVYMEDISPREQLQTTVKELEATGEELQSANEELEATNEELQSANEELETTNEELQSTNEELETTNEELQSLNEELQTANEELATRSKEMDELNARYAETLERVPWPVMVVGGKLKIEFWNQPAQRLFGFGGAPAAELRLEQLPVPQAFRNRLLRRYRATLARNTRTVLRDEVLDGPRSRSRLNVHFTPLAADGRPQSVLVMFEITSGKPAARGERGEAGWDLALAGKPQERAGGKPRRKSSPK
jgi:two-component system, chemotaxis family, CheB/CheR fusion protein